MGIVRNAKANHISGQAQTAHANGQYIFAALLNAPQWTFGASGEVPDWSAMIEAVETQGWALAQFAGTTDAKGNPQAYAVFRRR